MRATRWFLPDMPDVVGMLRAQIAVTIEGMDAFEAWAGGDAASGQVVSDMKPRADAAKRELLETLRVAFVLPLEPEDLFTLSRGIDWILDWSRDVVEEADVMAYAPDAGIAEMAARLSEAMRHIDKAVSLLGSDPDAATEAADAAIKAERALERAYYRGMAESLEIEEMRERIARRELYRRCSRIGDMVIDVAERVAYSVVKES